MILINKTMEIITEESAEDGEAAEQWTEYENAEFTIREIVKDIKGLEPSQYPITNPENVWFTSYGEMDYITGEYENYSLHYSRDNKSASLKHWIAAIKSAGFKVKV